MNGHGFASNQKSRSQTSNQDKQDKERSEEANRSTRLEVNCTTTAVFVFIFIITIHCTSFVLNQGNEHHLPCVLSFHNKTKEIEYGTVASHHKHDQDLKQFRSAVLSFSSLPYQFMLLLSHSHFTKWYNKKNQNKKNNNDNSGDGNINKDY